MAPQYYDFRCPIHGFIRVNEWERKILEHPAFQRLRRIRQLAWTDMVYPGAGHTRFEHSLGVMETATRMFDEIWRRKKKVLEDFQFETESAQRHRIILRLAALLHDVGHSPFSHAGEEVMPVVNNARVEHEAYSAQIIRHLMTDVIDDDVSNKRQFNVKAAEIADFIDGKVLDGPLVFWKQLLSSQLDADRADYLLRDSHHIGVQYGNYDLHRLLVSLSVTADPETENPIIVIDEGGWHSAEALIIARYLMFTQVYYHKTRLIYDFHLSHTLKSILANEQARSGLADPSSFPPPTDRENLEAYVRWDDWRVLGALANGGGEEHGAIIRARRHCRRVFDGGDFAEPGMAERYDRVKAALDGLVKYEFDANKSWYKKTDEILVARGDEDATNRQVRPLSQYSTVVKGMQEKSRIRNLYVALEDKQKAKEIIQATN